MRRLVYSPKAYVYIQTDEGMYNISDLVTAGSISRKVNQVSTAEVTFQNPNFTFTQPGTPTFRPMDKITIFLQRLPGFPVQSFTGYLDEAPYYQMYPGTVTLRASCTLKRLQHTYFDPGLPFMIAFMARYGWYVDPSSGSIRNAPDAPNGRETADTITSASLTDLMYACLKHIAGIDPGQILIEELPDSLIQRLAPLYHVLHERAEDLEDDFNQWLKDFIGGEQGAGGTTDPGASGTFSGDFGRLSKKYPLHSAGAAGAARLSVTEVRAAAELAGFSPGRALQMAQIARGESNYYPGVKSFDAGYGLWQMTPRVWGPVAIAYMNKLGGLDAMTIPIQNAKMAKFLYDDAGGFGPWYGTGFLDRNLDVSGVKSVLTDTQKNKQRTGSSGDKATSSGAEADQTKNATHGGSTSSTNPGKIFAPIAGSVVYGRGWHESSKGVTGMTNTSGSLHWHSGVDASVPGGTPCIAPTDGTITMALGSWSDGGMVHFKFTEQVGDIKAGTVIGWGHCINIRVKAGQKVKAGTHVADSGSPGGGPHVHFIQRNDDNGSDGSVDPVPLLKALQKGKTSPTAGGDTDAGADANQSSGYTDALAAARAGSVFTTMNFPQAVDATESILLKGDLALMNDQPLLPFIEQLSNGSLRNFMSLPNGDFYAFHPDYFGAMGTSPYWEIDDIEVLEGGIQLSDDALVTHAYVVGATLPEQTFDLVQKVGTHGVVNILNAGTSDFLNLDPKETKEENEPDNRKDKKEDELRPFLGSEDMTMIFLQRYGARPLVEEAPFIRSHLFETFYAYQKFMLAWARQFQTTFSFTFMPEIYPGGIVSFKGHGIQMYVDEVQHSWDYENGFTTQANLTAPAATGTDHKSISRGMVRSPINNSNKA